MELKTYLSREGIGVRAFARTCGVSAATVKRVRDSEVIPSRTTMTKIVTATGGLVTVHDLMSAIHDEATAQSKQGEMNHGESASP